LCERVDYFADDLAEILRDILPKDEADAAEGLANRCFSEESDAVDQVDKLLGQTGTDIDQVVTDGKRRNAEVLLQEYARGEPDAVKLVDEHLAGGGESLDGLTAAALANSVDADKLIDFERIDCLISIAESRRNASLHEIDRRRVVLGATLRRNVQEIEDAEFKVIESTPAKGKNAH
jgi:hypothetical protein